MLFDIVHAGFPSIKPPSACFADQGQVICITIDRMSETLPLESMPQQRQGSAGYAHASVGRHSPIVGKQII
ncbi:MULTISPECIES: hypothetical protein [unclassified Nocardia]|uniref:hypothetical protein n=1 Tax=unclassified Nocardia TaxID=2637762 RepID=UPI001CE496E0|nr:MULTISPECIES: hypothetical protein [unclassified Nocardia]